MAAVHSPVSLVEEFAKLLASPPTEEQLLSFRPSRKSQQRVRELLLKSNEGTLKSEEEHELNQYQNYEVLIRLVKARIHARRAQEK